jgi:hypothetical protein
VLVLVVEGMEDGFIREEEARGGAFSRALRISRSSNSEETSLMSPSEGSLSDTSSMRACDMIVVWIETEMVDWRRGGVEMVGFGPVGSEHVMVSGKEGPYLTLLEGWELTGAHAAGWVQVSTKFLEKPSDC